MTTSLIIGSVPAVFIGSLLSSSVPDRYVRPVIAFVIFASGLKYVGLDTTALGWVLCATLALIATAYLILAKPWRTAEVADLPVTVAEPSETAVSARR